MDPASTHRIAKFCADQYFEFGPDAWLESTDPVDRRTIAAAARYLSLTSWYGREEDLVRIAAALEHAAAASVLPVRDCALDLGSFSVALRMNIATRRLDTAHAALPLPAGNAKALRESPKAAWVGIWHGPPR